MRYKKEHQFNSTRCPLTNDSQQNCRFLDKGCESFNFSFDSKLVVLASLVSAIKSGLSSDKNSLELFTGRINFVHSFWNNFS